MRLALAIALATTAMGFAPVPNRHPRAIQTTSPSITASAPITATTLFVRANTEVDAQSVIDAAVGSKGVTLFGKSGCPFCKKAKKALYFIGVHPTIVELDQIEGGAKVQKKLEELTGKGTVPSVWLDGKFIGGSEEVIAGVDGDMFDGVEKKEIIKFDDEPAVPVEQNKNALKKGDKVPDVGLWQSFPSDAKVSLADIGKDKNILVVGLPGAFTPT